jgi:hypothetical protein
MRKVSMFIAGCGVFAFAISMFGQARDLDTIMKEIAPLWQGGRGAPGIGARGGALEAAPPDTAKIAADAAKLESLFKEAEAEFTKLKMTESATAAKNIAAAAGNLAKEAKAGTIADAAAAKTAIGQCKACHDRAREPDGAGGQKVKSGAQ